MGFGEVYSPTPAIFIKDIVKSVKCVNKYEAYANSQPVMLG